MSNCIITIKPATDTLADIYDFLVEHQYHFIRSITSEQLEGITSINPQFNEPTHLAQEIFVRRADKEANKPVYAIYSNLGHAYFSKGDCLEDLILNSPDLYFEYQIQKDGQWQAITDRDVLRFDAASSTEWKAQFDFERIFHHFGLDGENDYGPFMGFFTLT